MVQFIVTSLIVIAIVTLVFVGAIMPILAAAKVARLEPKPDRPAKREVKPNGHN